MFFQGCLVCVDVVVFGVVDVIVVVVIVINVGHWSAKVMSKSGQ